MNKRNCPYEAWQLIQAREILHWLTKVQDMSLEIVTNFIKLGNNMLTQINTSNYNRVALIILYSVEFISSYNHNYYYNKNTGDLILEEANDDQLKYRESPTYRGFLGST